MTGRGETWQRSVATTSASIHRTSCRPGRAALTAAAARARVGRDTRLRSVGNDEREQTLNQLLTELDGFASGAAAAPVICIAATNRPDVRAPPPAWPLGVASGA